SVQDILPEPEIHQEEINVSDEGDSAEDDVTRIGSTLEFEFTIENQNTSADDSELNNVTFKDEIPEGLELNEEDRKSTRLNSSHVSISYAVFCLKKKNQNTR